MNTYTSATRAACDRCHRLKMRCVVEENGSQCNRCVVAETPCNYSPPRKPGRPSMKNAVGAIEGLVTAMDSSARSAQPDSSSQGGRLTLAQNEFDLTEHMASFGPDTINDILTGDGLWQSPGFLEEFHASERAYMIPKEVWAGPASRTSMPPGNSHFDSAMSISQSDAGGPDDREEIAESPTQQSVFGSDNPVPAASGSNSPLDNKPIAQQISEFHSKLALCPNPEDHVEPQELERTAALVLELSDAFLGFFRSPRGGGTPQEQAEAGGSCREMNTNAPDDSRHASDFRNPATALQLVVFAMRLTELHQRLYTGVYKYMEQRDRLGHDATPISFAIAGVSLVPHPFFQMQLLLHTAAHYLHSIQKALQSILSPRPREKDPEGSSNSLYLGHAAAMRVLVEQDQSRSIGGIRETLKALQRDFNMAVHVESLFDRQSSHK